MTAPDPDAACREPAVPLMDGYDALVLDLDGVLHRGADLIAAAPRVLDRARAQHIPLLFLTNNSGSTPAQVADRLVALGLHARPQEVLTSAQATAAMIAAQDLAAAEAFVIGGPGIRDALSEVGVRVVDGEPRHVDLVVVGWDPAADYARLRTACLLVERGAELIATNPDASFPAADGLWPGAGALLAVITTTTGATPVVVGKPFPPMFEEARRRTGAARPLMVGDRLDTDIAGAATAGWDSALVLTGVSRPADLPSAPALPTYVASDIGALLEPRTPARIKVASRRDASRVTSLLRSAGLEPDGSAAPLARTIILEAGGAPRPSLAGGPDGTADDLPAATASLESAGGSNYLRSLAVRADLRHRGLGLLAAAAAVRLGDPMAPTYAATETAAPLFVRLGFEPIAGHGAPAAIQELIEAQGCAGSATMLRRGPTGLASVGGAPARARPVRSAS